MTTPIEDIAGAAIATIATRVNSTTSQNQRSGWKRGTLIIASALVSNTKKVTSEEVTRKVKCHVPE